MNYSHYYWKKNEEEKPKKSKKDEKNILLETEITRNIELDDALKNSERTFHDFLKINKKGQKVDHVNFRENIKINVQTQNKNRDVLEKRLNNRVIVNSGGLNPHLSQKNYVNDIENQDNFLRPKYSGF